MLGSVKSLSSSSGLGATSSPRFMDVPLTQETVEDRPWSTVVVDSRERKGTTGVYGVGLKVNVEKDFGVLAATGLQDKNDKNINSSVNVGDILCFVNDRSVEKEGSKIIENAIFGELGSLLKLSLKNAKTGTMYDLMVKRHVPIRTWEYNHQWYAVKEEYNGGELLTDARIVSALDNIRHCAIDDQGREVDFLAGIKKRGSSCGVELSPEKSQGGRRVEGIVQGSPAANANLRPGDVIFAVDGESKHEGIASLLGGEQRIGSICKIEVMRSGRKEHVELVRTQVSAMHRTAEMCEFIDGLAELQSVPGAAAALKKKVCELEKERLYEERVMAGRLNASNTTLLNEVWKAADTLVPPRPQAPDYSEALEQMKNTNGELTRALQLANSRNEELAAEVKRLQQMLNGMVPGVELDHIRGELENLKKLLADSVPRSQFEQMEGSLKGLIKQLEEEKRALGLSLKAAEQNAAQLKVENEELKRKLKLLEDENAAMRAEQEALKRAQEDMVPKAQYEQMEQALRSSIEQLRKEKKTLDETLRAEQKALEQRLRAEQKAMEERLRGEHKAMEERMRAEQKELAGRLRDAEQSNSKLQAENEELKRRLKVLEAENATLQQDNAALKKQLREVQGGKDGLDDEVAGLKRKLAAALEDLAAEKARLQAAEKSRSVLQGEKDALARRVTTLEDENGELRAAMEALKKALQAAKDEAERLAAEAKALRSRVAQLSAANEQLTKQLGSLKEKLKAAEEDAEKWRKIAEPLQAAMKGNQEELDAANAKLKALREENAALKDELAALKLRLKQVEAEAASLKADLASLKEELKRAKAEAAEAWKQLDAANKKMRELEDQVSKLEQEKATLSKQLAAANEQVGKLKRDLEAGHRQQRGSEDEKIKLKAEIEALKSQLQDANEKLASTQTQLKGAQAQNAALADELKTTHERVVQLQAELDKAKQEIAELKEEVRKLKLQAAELERKLKKAEGEAAQLQGKVDELTRQLEAAKQKIASLEEELEKEQKAHEATRKQLNSANEMLTKLKGELEASKRSVADKGVYQDQLEALLRELRGATLDQAAFRAEFLSAMTAEPMLQPAGVLRMMQGAKALPTTKLETVCEVLEALAHPDLLAADVLELLKLMRDGRPRRSAMEVQLVLKVLNQEEAWSGETLLQMREALQAEGVTRAEQVVICPDKQEHVQLQQLRQRVRELLAPEFDQKGCTFLYRHPLTIRGRPGSTIYACIGEEAERPSKNKYDKMCESPMELVLEDSCVVTAIATMEGALQGGDDLSAPRTESFTRKRMVTREAAESLARAVPILPEERVGVGMLIEKDQDEHADIIVKSIMPGGEVDRDGRVSVGDVLLEVDGRDLDGVDLQDVRELMMGPAATEVVMVLERRGAQRSGEGVVADNLYSVHLFRAKSDAVPSTFSPQSFVDSGRNLLDSGKNILEGIQQSASAAVGPRATKTSTPPTRATKTASPALSQSQFSTVSAAAGQTPITVSSSPGMSLVNRGPGVNSPGIYMSSPGTGTTANGELLIAM